MDILTATDEIPDDAQFIQYQDDGTKHVFYISDGWPDHKIEHDKTTAIIDRAKNKSRRSNTVNSIKVTTTAGNTFDGDKASQVEILKHIATMDDSELVLWVMADNKPVEVKKIELIEALKRILKAQQAVWVI